MFMSALLLSLCNWQEKVDVEGSGGQAGDNEPPTEAGAVALDTSSRDEAENRGQQV